MNILEEICLFASLLPLLTFPELFYVGNLSDLKKFSILRTSLGILLVNKVIIIEGFRQGRRKKSFIRVIV